MCNPPTPNPRMNAPSTPTAISPAKAVTMALRRPPPAPTPASPAAPAKLLRHSADQKMLAGTCEMAKVLAVHTATDGGTPWSTKCGTWCSDTPACTMNPAEGEDRINSQKARVRIAWRGVKLISSVCRSGAAGWTPLTGRRVGSPRTAVGFQPQILRTPGHQQHRRQDAHGNRPDAQGVPRHFPVPRLL